MRQILASQRQPTKSLEWLHVHELRGIVPSDGLHLIDVLDLIQRLDVIRIDLFQPQGIEAVSTDIGIVAGIQELAAAIFFERNDSPLERIRSPRNHVAELPVDLLAEHAAADSAAIDILVDRGAAHQHAGKVRGVDRRQLPAHVEVATNRCR